MSPSTAVYLSAPEGATDADGDGGSAAAAAISRLALTDPDAAATSAGAASRPLRLSGGRTRAARPPATDMVNVTTSDDEIFPVKKKLLRSCIALTKVALHLARHVLNSVHYLGIIFAHCFEFNPPCFESPPRWPRQAVRDSGDMVLNTRVNVDCLTFDRVLLFLEAHLLGRPPPQWSLHLVDDLSAAAEALGLRPLTEYCQQRLGAVAQGIRIHRYEEVVAANARGELWLVLDSMVLDVKAWLPEHPGACSILPWQNLNIVFS